MTNDIMTRIIFT